MITEAVRSDPAFKNIKDRQIKTKLISWLRRIPMEYPENNKLAGTAARPDAEEVE